MTDLNTTMLVALQEIADPNVAKDVHGLMAIASRAIVETRATPPEPSDVVVPTVHLNGTSKGALIEQLCDAGLALSKARHALCEAAPHERDYYVQREHPVSYRLARAQFQARLVKLDAVAKDLFTIVEGISSQGK